MILQALHDYYLRKSGNPDPSQRLPGFGSRMWLKWHAKVRQTIGQGGQSGQFEKISSR